MALTDRLSLAVRALVGTLPADMNPLDRDPSSPARLLTGILPGCVGTPPKRGTQQFLDAYETMPLLRMVTGRIADSVSSVHWQVFAVTPKRAEGKAVMMKGLRRSGPIQRHAMLSQLRERGELKEFEEHPFLELLDGANEYHTGRAVRKISQVAIDTVGESFWLKERNGVGAPIGVWPIPAHWIKATPTLTHRMYQVSFRGWQGEVPDTEIFWAAEPAPSHPYARGVGVGNALADDFETDKYAAIMTKQKFFNNMRPDILITAPALSESDTRRLERDWQQKHMGMWQQWKARFLNKEVKVHEFDQDLRANQFVQLRQHERDFVAQVYGVPPEILGIVENSNRATIEAAENLYMRFVIVPRLEFWRTNLQERFISEYDERLIIDYVNPVPDDKEYALKAAMAAPWALSIDEWRERAGLDPLEDERGKSIYMVPMGVTATTEDDLVNPPEEPEEFEEEPGSVIPIGGAPPRPPKPRPQPAAGAKEYDESQHPRVPAGSSDGGQWTDAPGGGGGSPSEGGAGGGGSYADLVESGKVKGELEHVPPAIRRRIEAVIEEHYRDFPTAYPIEVTDDPERIEGWNMADSPTGMGYIGDKKSLMLIDPKWMSSDARLAAMFKQSDRALRRAIQRMKRDGIPVPDSLAARELLQMMGYPGPKYVEPTIEGCIVHEFGHAVKDKLQDSRQPDFRKAIHDKRWRSKALRVSLRAADSFDEYVAEAFQLYRSGKSKGRLDGNLRRAFESMRRKKAA